MEPRSPGLGQGSGSAHSSLLYEELSNICKYLGSLTTDCSLTIIPPEREGQTAQLTAVTSHNIIIFSRLINYAGQELHWSSGQLILLWICPGSGLRTWLMVWLPSYHCYPAVQFYTRTGPVPIVLGQWPISWEFSATMNNEYPLFINNGNESVINDVI